MEVKDTLGRHVVLRGDMCVKQWETLQPIAIPVYLK